MRRFMRHFRHKPRVYILGGYGYGNVGDEACRVATMDMLRKIHPNIEIETHHGLRNPAMRSKGRLNVNPKRFDACVVGGGGILYDHIDETDNLGYYLGCVKGFLDAGRPVYIIGVGTQGKFEIRRSHQLIKRVLNRCQLITVRSLESALDLEKCGVNQPIHVSADLAFLLEPKSWSKPPSPADTNLTLGVGISFDTKNDTIRPFHEGFNEKVKRLIENLMDKKRLVFYVFDPRFDLAFAKDKEIINEADPENFLSYIKLCDSFITTRYHGLIFSLLGRVPCLSILDHGDKKHRLTTRIGFPSFCFYSDSVSDIEEKLDNPSPIRARWVKELRKASEINYKLLKEALEDIL